MDYLIYLILPISIPAVIAYFISHGIFARLKKNENKNAKMISIITFIGGFLVMLAGIFYALLSMVRLER